MPLPKGAFTMELRFQAGGPESWSADAVIVCLMKFCDPEEYEYVA